MRRDLFESVWGKDFVDGHNLANLQAVFGDSGWVLVEFVFWVLQICCAHFAGPWKSKEYLGAFKNNGTPKSSILIGFSIINHPFWRFPHIFGNIHLLNGLDP